MGADSELNSHGRNLVVSTMGKSRHIIISIVLSATWVTI